MGLPINEMLKKINVSYFYYNNLNRNQITFHIEGNEFFIKTRLLEIVLPFGHITILVTKTHSKGI